MKEYNSIDLMKFVMALCVVTIHTYVVGSETTITNDLIHSLIRSAVPFFFMSSAFFVVGRQDKGYERKYLLRILQLYAVWGILTYILVSLMQHTLTGENTVSTLYIFIFNGYSVFWYLWGLLVAMPIVRKMFNGGGTALDVSLCGIICLSV